ncbi:MFS general substrate transporter [Auricularia subglabra TFB-10046 SS5]|nr:MFS general substrate transporter [Auricularia subglabra TFB-10046 SS5]
MGLGVLADKHLGENVPGTELLDDLHASRRRVHAADSHLKRDKHGLVLIPQPSDDPEDPLNWPLWRKNALMLVICYGAGLVGAFGPIIGAGLVTVAEDLKTTPDAISKLTGDTVLAIGLFLLITAPCSVLWGRRPVFLVGNILLLASSIWSALAADVSSLTAARVIGGCGMAPIEALVEATVADLFFVHERGLWISIWSFALLGGINLVYIVNGFLIQNVSWRVCFVIEGALFAVLLVLTILFVPETAYVRKEVSTLSEETPSSDMVEPVAIENTKEKEGTASNAGSSDIELQQPSPPQSQFTTKQFLQSLKPWTGERYTETSFLTLAIRPFSLVPSPIVLWGTLIYGTTQCWLVLLSVSISLLFSTPQFGYNFGAGAVGLISGVGPLIASFLGNAITGPLSDWSVTRLARMNGGVYEPEFRLVMIIPVLVTQTMGWFGWAISAHLLEPWIAPAIFDSLINFGQAVAGIAVVAYVVDAHPNYAPETFAVINALKNCFIFGITYVAIPWIENQGVLKCFSTIGGLVIAVCLTTIPMYIYGKRARSWVHRTRWVLT